jgi:beta-aspartyl-peptidase (threonine type)
MKPSIIVHGGAWDIPDDLVDAHLSGCGTAMERGYDELSRGGSAVQAVVEAIAVMEDDPVFDAGRGSYLNQVGQVELDAVVMDGATLRSGAVAALQHVRNPIRVARDIMVKTPFSMLVGSGALKFALDNGFERCTEEDLLVGRQLEDYREFVRTGVLRTREFFEGRGDTVGACAMDSYGHLAAATSTGGIPRKPAGRVGDSPLIGCGAYADGRVGAASATGWGEKIMAVLLAKAVLNFLETRVSPTEACTAAISMLKDRVDGLGGLIIVDTRGNIGYHHNTPRMAFGFFEGTTGRKKVAISV